MRFTRTQKRQRGFTLIELVVVLTILAMLAALVVPRLFKNVDKSKVNAAKAQISALETALDAYRLDVGSYPTTEQGLQALRTKPSGVDKWDGPYIPKEVPMDPWGNPYHYKQPSDHGDYEIVCYGADGREGGDGINADVVSWK
ncbi:MAG TPA: type II secretion system major pseudopilin GspG [Terriglobales bacterium]|nr:type II secretion system major pseudopilin GspG [Terriglobales bacterium]